MVQCCYFFVLVVVFGAGSGVKCKQLFLTEPETVLGLFYEHNNNRTISRISLKIYESAPVWVIHFARFRIDLSYIFIIFFLYKCFSTSLMDCFIGKLCEFEQVHWQKKRFRIEICFHSNSRVCRYTEKDRDIGLEFCNVANEATLSDCWDDVTD